MKFVCDGCQAKYQVPDERIVGKKLKVRCRRCGATIVVRGQRVPEEVPAAAAVSMPHAGRLRTASYGGGQGGQATAVAREHSGSGGEWFVSLDGAEHGPMEEDALTSWVTAHTGAWDAYVWREGFSDWMIARDVPELVQAANAHATGGLAGSAGMTPRSVAGAWGAEGWDDDREPTQMMRTRHLARPGRASQIRETSPPPEPVLPAPNMAPSGSFYSNDAWPGNDTGRPEPAFNDGFGFGLPSGIASSRGEESVLFSAADLRRAAAHSAVALRNGYGSPAPGYSVGAATEANGASADPGSGLIDIRALAALNQRSQVQPNPSVEPVPDEPLPEIDALYENGVAQEEQEPPAAAAPAAPITAAPPATQPRLPRQTPSPSLPQANTAMALGDLQLDPMPGLGAGAASMQNQGSRRFTLMTGEASQRQRLLFPVVILGAAAFFGAAVLGASYIFSPDEPEGVVATAESAEKEEAVVRESSASSPLGPGEENEGRDLAGNGRGADDPQQGSARPVARSRTGTSEEEGRRGFGLRRGQRGEGTVAVARRAREPERAPRARVRRVQAGSSTRAVSGSRASLEDVLGEVPERGTRRAERRGATAPTLEPPVTSAPRVAQDTLIAVKPAPSAQDRSLDQLLAGAIGDGPTTAGIAANGPSGTGRPGGQSSEGVLPEQPARDDVLGALRAITPRVQRCASDNGVTGLAKVVLSVAGSTGKVSAVDVSGVDGPVRGCIGGAVKDARFPRFQKALFNITFPFRLN